MKVAIAMTSNHNVYHNNPCTAPKFAVYTIEKEDKQIRYALSAVFDNPALAKNAHTFTDAEIYCRCNIDQQNDFSHACQHYALLDVIGGSNYLLADKYCQNTLRSLNNGGVAIYKIPSIINKVDIAIKNFLLGAHFASTVQHIHHAS